MQQPMEKDLVVNNQLIHYYHAPVSPLKQKGILVFLHGWGSNSPLWFSSTLGLVEQGYELYFFDLPGFGKSQSPKRPFHLEDYAEIITQLMNKLSIIQPILIGHSVGGKIAVRIASKKMIPLKGLILVDSSGLAHTSFITQAKIQIAKTVSPLFRLPPFKDLRARLLRMSGSDDYVAFPELRETFIYVVGEHIKDELPRVTMPTLVVWGENDTNSYTPPSDALIFKNTIPGAHLEILKKAGHYCFLDNPSGFAVVTLSFITSLHGED